MEDEQLQTTGEPVGDGDKKEKKNDKDIYNLKNSAVYLLTPYLGKDRHANLAAVRKKLINDEAYLDKVVGNILAKGVEDDSYYRNNPEQHYKDFVGVRNGIRERLSSEIFDGDDIKDSIIKRSSKLQKNNDILTKPIEEYKGIIKNNKEEFIDFGILDENNNIALSNNAFKTTLASNPDLYDKILDKRYSEFTNTLNKKNNLGVIDQEDANDMAEAFVVYDQFGPEGVTQFANSKKFVEGKPLEEQTQSVQDAIEFMDGAKKNGKTPQQYINDFIGHPEDKNGAFEYKPITESAEMKVDLPLDTNKFTTFWHTNKVTDLVELSKGNMGPDSGEEPTSTFGKAVDWLSDVYGELTYSKRVSQENTESSMAMVSRMITGNKELYNEMLKKQASGEIESKWFGEPVDNPIFWDATPEQITESFRNSDKYDDHLYRNFRIGLLKEAERGENISIKDLVQTIAVNSAEERETDSVPEYVINPENLPERAKVALDTLFFSDRYKGMFREEGDLLIFQPNYQERYTERGYTKTLIAPIWGKESKVNEDGTIESHPVPNVSGGFEFLNTTWQLGYGATKALSKTMDGIFPYNEVRKGLEAIGKPLGLDDDVNDFYYDYVKPFNDLDVQQSELSSITSKAAYAGEFISYLGQAFYAGGKNLKAFQNLSKARTVSFNGTKMQLAPLKKTSRLGKVSRAMRLREAKALKKDIKTPTQAFLKFEVGALSIDATKPQEYSLYSNGTADMVLDYVGLGEDINLEQKYKASNRLTQMAADVATTEALAVFADLTLATMRWGGNLLFRRGGRGVLLDETGGNYVKQAKGDRKFTPDVRRTYTNLMNDVARLEKGDMVQARVRTLDGKLSEMFPQVNKDLAGITSGFISKVDPLVADTRQQIREGLEFWDNKITGTSRTPEQLDKETDAIMDKYLEGLGKNLQGHMSMADEHQVVFDFADNLANTTPTIRQIDFVTDGGEAKSTMGYMEALELKGDDNSIMIKSIGNEQYEVYRVDGSNWRLRVAESMKKNYIDDNVDEAFDKYAKRVEVPEGTDISKAEFLADQKEKFKELFGQQITVNGERGRVIDIDEDGYVVRLDNGETVSEKNVPKQYTELKKGNSTKKNKKVPQTGLRTDELESKIETIRSDRSKTSTRLDKLRTQKQKLEQNQTKIETEEISDKEAFDRKIALNDNKLTEVENEIATLEESLGVLDERLMETAEQLEQVVKNSDELKQHKKAIDEKNNALDTDIDVPVEKTDAMLESQGLSENFFQPLLTIGGYKRKGKDIAAKMAKLFGGDGNSGHSKYAANGENIKKFDAKKSKKNGGIPEDVVVKQKTDGMTEHYITNTHTHPKSTPTVWIKTESDEFMYNPYFSRINKNVTLDENGRLVPYKRAKRKVEDGTMKDVYVRTTMDDEDAVFLNVQKPTRKTGMTDDEIMSKNIDAYEHKTSSGVSYELINEGQQAIKASKLKDASPSSRYTDVKEITPTKSDKRQVEEMIVKEVSKEGVTGVIGWGLAGNMAGRYFDDEDEDMYSGIFGGIGMLLGSRKFRSGIGGFMKGRLAKTTRNGQPFKEAVSHVEADQKMFDQADLRELGFTDGLVDDDVAQGLRSNLNDLTEGGRNTADNIKEALTRNSFVTSTYTILKEINSKKAREFYEFLDGFNPAVNRIKSAPTLEFENTIHKARKAKHIADGMDEREADVLARQEADGYEDVFIDEVGPSLITPIIKKNMGGIEGFSDEMLEKQAKKRFNESIARIMHSGAKKTDDLDPEKIDNKAVLEFYNDEKFGQQFLEVDRELLKNGEVQSFIQTQRDWFSNLMGRWMKGLDDQITINFNHAARDYDNIGLVKRMLDSDLTRTAFRKELTKPEKVKFDKLVGSGSSTDAGKALSNVFDIHATKMRFTNLDERYYPQHMSLDKHRNYMEKVRKKLSGTGTKVFFEGQERSFDDLTKAESRQYAEDMLTDRIIRMNAKDPDKIDNVLKEIDDDTGEYLDKTFESVADAQSEIKSMLASVYDKADGASKSAEIREQMDSFIKEREVRVGDKVSKKYTIEVPDKYKDLLSKENRKQKRAMFMNIANPAVVSKSSYLENPRIKMLPFEIVETDIKRLRQNYSYDVGRRLHNIEHGIYTADDLDDVFMNKMFKNVDNPEKIKKYKGIIKSTYNQVNGVYGKTGEEIEKNLKLNFWGDFISKAYMARFGLGFHVYNSFEWMVAGPNISSYKMIGRTANKFRGNKTAVDNWEKMLLTNHIVEKTITSIRPEIDLNTALKSDAKTLGFKAHAWGGQLAENVGKFSFGNGVRKQLKTRMGLNISESPQGFGKIVPVAGDSFLGGNIFASAINGKAAVGEAIRLGEAGKMLKEASEELAEGQANTIRLDGKVFSLPEVERQLELLGVNDIDGFIKKTNDLTQAVKGLDNEKGFVNKFYENDPALYDDMVRILDKATNTYHGTSKIDRMEKWNTAFGKTLSMFSSYSQNFGLQNFQKRIRQPIQAWKKKHGADIGVFNTTSEKVSLFDLARYAKNGNANHLTRKGVPKEMIEDLPLQAYLNVGKVMGSMGISVAGFMSLDVINDIIAYPFNEAMDREQWQRLTRNKYVNPFAPESSRKTWGELLGEGPTSETVMQTVGWVGGSLARAGYMGKYGDFVQNRGQLAYRGITSLSPVTADIERGLRWIMKDKTDMSRIQLASDIGSTALSWTPIAASNIFSETRKALTEVEPEVPYRRSDMFDMDSSTGDFDIDIEMEMNME